MISISITAGNQQRQTVNSTSTLLLLELQNRDKSTCAELVGKGVLYLLQYYGKTEEAFNMSREDQLKKIEREF